MSFFFLLALTFFLFLCFVLCFLVLIQEGKGGGLGASFGGDASDSMFGTSTPDVLKKLTGYMALVFVALCIILSFWTSSIGRSKGHFSALDETIENVQ